MTKHPVVFTIQVRNPTNREESKIYGMTWSKAGQATIFVNARKNRNRTELLDTLLHELYHAVVGSFKFSTKNEEKFAQELGRYLRDRPNDSI